MASEVTILWLISIVYIIFIITSWCDADVDFGLWLRCVQPAKLCLACGLLLPLSRSMHIRQSNRDTVRF